MTATVARTAISATKASGRTCATLAANGSVNFAIVSRIKSLYATKTAQTLAHWLGISPRTAKHRLSCTREFSVEEIGTLLHSEHGFEIVAAIMATSPKQPEWWRICSPVMEAANIRRMQMLAQRRISKALEEALDADRNLTDTIARAESVAVQDQDFYRPHLDALRSTGRAQNRAVAQARRQVK
jgi:hypothetical protein